MSRPSLRKERWPLFVMSAFLWIGLPLEAQQNGIYIQNTDGPLMTTQDGKQAHLGDRRILQIRESVFMPRNNENSSFYLSIRVPEDPALRRALHVLVVNGVAYRQYGGGYGEGFDSLGFEIQGMENARQIAAYLRASPNFRQRPTHKLEVTFLPAHPVFQLGSDVQVKMRLTNAGSQPIAFMVNGGTTRYGNPYAFVVRYLGRVLDERQRGICVDCIDAAHVLKAGEVYEQEVNLSQRYSFQNRGTYFVHGSFFLDLRPPVDSLRSSTLWEEYVSHDFQIVIE